jgi:hypothetical protein
MLRKLILITVLISCTTPSLAQLPPPPPFPFPPIPLPQGTPEERAACSPDVHKYCEQALPDTMQVANCLQANKARLSPACRQVLSNHGM